MRIQIDKNKFDAALSNRLEDRNKAEQYYKGILTDVTPAKIVGTAKNKYIRENYSLEDRDYFFTEFDNVEIGARVAFDKKDYLVIEGLRINYCGPGGKFCVSVFRQNQEYHVINVHDGAYSPWSTLSRQGGTVYTPRAA